MDRINESMKTCAETACNDANQQNILCCFYLPPRPKPGKIFN
jgi:hypothetical protein